MTDHELPWWVLSAIWIVGETVILIGVAAVVLRSGRRSPRAARLFLAAIGIHGLSVLASLVQAIDPFSVGNIIMHDSDGPNLADPAVVQLLVIQAIYSVCSIAAWSLIAWAILMRPDEPRRRAVA